MAVEITMPALSPTMEEGNLAKWLVKEGDSVAAGDVIAEIETDKATMEVEAVDEGTIAKILVEGGTEGVKVNAVIAILAEEGEDVAEAAKGGGSAPTPVSAPSVAPAAAPAEAKAEAAPKAPVPVAAPSGSKVKASPLAKRIAKEGGLDIALVAGSGPHGRIIKRDVDKALKEGVSAPAMAASKGATSFAAPQGMSDDAVRKLFPEGSYEELPHNGMRRIVASRLTESSQTIPSYFVSMDCALDALLKLRGEINKSAPVVDDKPAYKLSVNDFIIKALALALRDVPMANASWTSDARLLHKSSDVGVAVAVPDGLFTPIVRDAQTKALSTISTEVKDMAKRARDGKLKPEEYQGGTTAVSNLGMFGVSNFTSIINPPHASIVSIGAGKQQPVVKDGVLAVGTVMTATFAFDHRVIDGALGAELAKAFQTYIENPIAMLV